MYISSGNGTVHQATGHLMFQNCTAGGRGGGLYLGSADSGGMAHKLGLVGRVSLDLKRCKQPGWLTHVLVDHCTTDFGAGTLFSASKSLHVSNLTIREPRSVDFDIIVHGQGLNEAIPFISDRE